MKLTKPSTGLIAEFKGVQEQLREAQPRKMFGYDALFVNGYLAVGLWKNTCTLKLSEGDQKKLIAAGNAKPFMPMPGRPMNGWVELAEDLANDPEELLAWSRRAVEYVMSLPPKPPSAKKASPKKPAPKKALAKKAAAKKAPAKKPPAKKTKKA